MNFDFSSYTVLNVSRVKHCKTAKLNKVQDTLNVAYFIHVGHIFHLQVVLLKEERDHFEQCQIIVHNIV